MHRCYERLKFGNSRGETVNLGNIVTLKRAGMFTRQLQRWIPVKKEAMQEGGRKLQNCCRKFALLQFSGDGGASKNTKVAKGTTGTKGSKEIVEI